MATSNQERGKLFSQNQNTTQNTYKTCQIMKKKMSAEA
jgi:hypothetical protein